MRDVVLDCEAPENGAKDGVFAMRQALYGLVTSASAPTDNDRRTLWLGVQRLYGPLMPDFWGDCQKSRDIGCKGRVNHHPIGGLFPELVTVVPQFDSARLDAPPKVWMPKRKKTRLAKQGGSLIPGGHGQHASLGPLGRTRRERAAKGKLKRI
jgi:hypothetical protein